MTFLNIGLKLKRSKNKGRADCNAIARLRIVIWECSSEAEQRPVKPWVGIS